MATWSLTSQARAVSFTAAKLNRTALIVTTAAAVASTNAVPYKLTVTGEIGPIPWFDLPPA